MTDQLRNSLPPRARATPPTHHRRSRCGSCLDLSTSVGGGRTPRQAVAGPGAAAGVRIVRASTSVILEGRLAGSPSRRHGLQIKKRLQRGAVVEVTPEQLAALADDPAIAHLSGDARVRRHDGGRRCTATGADQVWGGVSGLPGYTGRGIGVAVIDSGVCESQVDSKTASSRPSTSRTGRTARTSTATAPTSPAIIAGNDGSAVRRASRPARTSCRFACSPPTAPATPATSSRPSTG